MGVLSIKPFFHTPLVAIRVVVDPIVCSFLERFVQSKLATHGSEAWTGRLRGHRASTCHPGRFWPFLARGARGPRPTAVSSPEPHRLLELNASITFAMIVDLDVAQRNSSAFASPVAMQWKNASDIYALWVLDPETMQPWPNTAPGGAPSAGAHSSMGSGGPLTHLDLVWGDNAPFAGGWQLMSSVLPPGLVARARAAGHRGKTKLNITVGAIIWHDLYGHTLRKPSRDLFEALTSDDAFVVLPDLPPPRKAEETAPSRANSVASAYTPHFLEPTDAQKMHPSARLLVARSYCRESRGA
jgi:hypothetical protein